MCSRNVLRMMLATSAFLAIGAQVRAQDSAPADPALVASDDPAISAINLGDPGLLPGFQPSAPAPLQLPPREQVTWSTWLGGKGVQPHFSVKTEGSFAMGPRGWVATSRREELVRDGD